MRTLLAELTRDEAARRAAEAVAVVPVGACEQHGPHLPVGTDLFAVAHIAQQAAVLAAGTADVIVTPPVPFGYSPYHLPHGPTVTLRTSTLHALLYDVCDSLVRSGFRRVFLLNGHGGNAELIAVVAREAGVDLGVLVGAGSYWTMAWDALEQAGAQERGRLPGHAGAFETSLVAALRPDLVVSPPRGPDTFTRNPRGFARPYLVEDPLAWAGEGFSDNPSAASAADGARWLDLAAGAVAQALQEFAALPLG
ncbi:creatininase family protein [Dactylosporangium fulvum]|uniref:Creatininase family protein n=1 Tax=Dactylosporangium fulvum TaxID=53359 RepID=A0ABY5W7M0_9ACTN|nr:creatininase family protein [Dactylosporangium fulvum]UWP85311.1 creatininase family protein [Dactylosporangium fulvum]